MRRRYLYLLLFAVPAALVALIAAGVAVAGAAGVLWLFVFGDDPWPRQSDLIFAAVAVLGPPASMPVRCRPATQVFEPAVVSMTTARSFEPST